MAVGETTGLFRYINEAGEEQILYPITKKDAVDGVEEIEDALAEEIERAKGAEQEISSALSAESTRAEEAEGALQTSVNGLNTALQEEVSRAQESEATISTVINNEVARAQEAEESLNEDIGVLQGALSEVQDSVTALGENKLDKITSNNAKVYGVNATGQVSWSFTPEVSGYAAVQRDNGGAIAMPTPIKDTDGVNKAYVDEKNDAQDTAIQNAQDTADTAESIARGRSQARVFNTKADMDAWLAVSTNTTLLQVGDNLYIKDLGVPDYWWNGESASPLEAEKPDLTEYPTKVEVEAQIDEEKSRAEGVEGALLDTIELEVSRATSAEEDLSSSVSTLQSGVTALQAKDAAQDTAIEVAQSAAEEAQSTADSKYAKPAGGIPKTDLTTTVQLSLDKADTALQEETDPTVPNWAKQAEKPTYTKSEVGLGNVDNVRQYSADNEPPYPVTSVNGKTGSVTLSAANVSAIPKASIFDGAILNQSLNINRFVDCFTRNTVAEKVVSAPSAIISDVNILSNIRITVRFVYANTANSPTLNVNNMGAKPIKADGDTTNVRWLADAVMDFVYDGTYWVVVGGYQLAGKRVGCVYISDNATSPATLFGGSWTQIKGRFLLGYGADSSNPLYKGTYSSTTQYYVNEIVSYTVSNTTTYYICKADVKGILPTNNTYWAAYTVGYEGGAAKHVHDAGDLYAQFAISTSANQIHLGINPNVSWSNATNRTVNLASLTDGGAQTEGLIVSGATNNASSMPLYRVEYKWYRTA